MLNSKYYTLTLILILSFSPMGNHKKSDVKELMISIFYIFVFDATPVQVTIMLTDKNF